MAGRPAAFLGLCRVHVLTYAPRAKPTPPKWLRRPGAPAALTVEVRLLARLGWAGQTTGLFEQPPGYLVFTQFIQGVIGLIEILNYSTGTRGNGDIKEEGKQFSLRST